MMMNLKELLREVGAQVDGIELLTDDDQVHERVVERVRGYAIDHRFVVNRDFHYEGRVLDRRVRRVYSFRLNDPFDDRYIWAIPFEPDPRFADMGR